MFQGLSVWAIIETGGPTMYVLLACSVLSVSVIVERIICYWLNSAVTRSAFLAAIGKALKRGGREDALAVCAKVRAPFARVAAVGLSHGASGKASVGAMEREI